MNSYKDKQIEALEAELKEMKRFADLVGSIVRERIAEASRLDITGKAILIAHELGKWKIASMGRVYTYKGPNFTIRHDDANNRLFVMYGKKTVFLWADGEVKLYKPGDWYSKFQKLWEMAYKKQLVDSIEEITKQVEALQANWGITDEEVMKVDNQKD